MKRYKQAMGMLKHCHSFSFSIPRTFRFCLRLPGNNKQGFTLLEVMIAVSIMAIALVALFGSQSRSLTHATEAHFNVVAPMLASGKLAELKADTSAPNNDDGDFGDDYPGYTWEIETENAIFDSPDALGNLEKPLQKVELTISWNETRYNYILTYYGHWQE